MGSVGCVALPKPPSTPLCLFNNKDAKGKAIANPKDFYFQCINAKNTRYEISVLSESADKMVATPYPDFLELQAYINKMADVFKREFVSKVGGK